MRNQQKHSAGFLRPISLAVRSSSLLNALAFGTFAVMVSAWGVQWYYENTERNPSGQGQYQGRHLLIFQIPGVTDVMTVVGSEPSHIDQLPTVDPPSWSIIAANPGMIRGENISERTVAFGLPLRAFKYSTVTDYSGGGTIVTAQTESFGRFAGLAVFPIWPGLIVNVICYSALFYLTCVGWRAWRIQRALSRMACWQCGYDLRRSVSPRCPECGVEWQSSERNP